MKDIINYFNNNAFITSLITICLSAIITIIINIINKRIERKDKEKDNKRSEYQNRAELRIEKHKKLKFNDQINVTYSSYKANGDKSIINKNIAKQNLCDYMYLPITNIGKSAIREMYITVNNRNHTFITEEDRVKSMIKGQYVNFVVPYYNKLLPDESIIILLNFLKKDKIFGTFSAELTIYYMDDYGNCYYQPLFLNDRRLEGPYKIEYKDYRNNTSLII